jgi:hypothetical protein
MTPATFTPGEVDMDWIARARLAPPLPLGTAAADMDWIARARFAPPPPLGTAAADMDWITRARFAPSPSNRHGHFQIEASRRRPTVRLCHAVPPPRSHATQAYGVILAARGSLKCPVVRHVPGATPPARSRAGLSDGWAPPRPPGHGPVLSDWLAAPAGLPGHPVCPVTRVSLRQAKLGKGG